MVAVAPREEGPSREIIARWNDALEGADPDTIIRFAVEHFGPSLAVATQFGPEGVTLLHRVSSVSTDVRFFTIDTGLMFQETTELSHRVEERLGIEIERIRPRQSLAEQAATQGPNLWETHPDLCCTLRKVQPMVDALYGMGAWMTGLRRSQSPSRANTPVVQWDERFGLVKFAPLAGQSEEAVAAYLKKNRLPTNPLRNLGYLSIGCLTCTRAVGQGEDPRAGRWAGQEKTECGLHTADSPEMNTDLGLQPSGIKRARGIR